MDDTPVERAEGGDPLVRALIDQVQRIALASDKIGATFSATHGMHPTDFRALTLIFQAEKQGEPLTARALANALNVSPGAVTYAVDRLAASGHVWRDTDPADGRRVLLRFADHGRQVAGEFFGPLGRTHAEAMASYTPEELATCLRFLTDVTRALDAFDGQLRSSL